MASSELKLVLEHRDRLIPFSDRIHKALRNVPQIPTISACREGEPCCLPVLDSGEVGGETSVPHPVSSIFLICLLKITRQFGVSILYF